MFERFTQDARIAVVAATAEAERRDDHHVGTEHLLLGIIVSANPITRAALHGKQVDLDTARRALDDADAAALAAIGIDVGTLAPAAGGATRPEGRNGRNRSRRPLTGGAKEALSGALRVAVGHRHHHIGSEDVLLALCARPRPDPAVQLLSALGTPPADLRADIERRLAEAA